ncbi:hypothetical protein SLS55_008230 [Diplodia seriata]|uniref:Amidase domain-containing protein n=1 Tax=Diplodia seriata TaxID=420778 RepID=A0ABR3C9X4_9PEZI
MGSTGVDSPPWLAKAERKRALQQAAIHSFLSEYPPLPAPERRAAESVPDIDDVEELLSTISTRAVSAEEVVVAYTHSLTELLFDDAVRRAKELDRHLAATGKPIGPLHGLPVTLKDQFDVKGYDSTIGYVAKAFRSAPEDAVVVALLRELGAIIIAKTNLPQSIMEAYPKQSGRLPYQNVTVSTDGQEHVPSVIGPLARTLSSLRFVTKSVVDAAPWQYDPKVVPLPWRADVEAEIQSRPLVIGLLVDDGVVRVHPPVERVVREAARKLEAAGHEVIPWDYSGHQECIDIMDQFYTADGGEDIRREVLAGGEPFIPHVEALVNRGKPISVYAYWQLNKMKHEQQKRYLDKWNAVRSPSSGRMVDVLLTPVMPHSAVPHRGCRWVGYTKVWNFLDYSAVVLPAGAVDKTVDAKADVASYAPRNELDRWNWNLYDPEAMDGMPVGVQIVGRKLEEEKVLGAAKAIESVLRKK